MRNRFISSIALLTFGLCGCATARRDSAASIATAGANLAAALAASTNRIANEVSADPAITAFHTTYTSCKGNYDADPKFKKCSPDTAKSTKVQNQGSNDERDYGHVLELEASALSSMGSAYDALKTESNYDEGSELGGALNGASKAVTALAETAFPGAKLLPFADLIKAAGMQAGALRQRERIMHANDRLQAVAELYLQVIEEQKRSVRSAINEIQHNRQETLQAMIDEGLVSRTDLFGKIVALEGIQLTADAAATVAKSGLLKDSIDAALRENAAALLQSRLRNYDTSLAALEALIAAHNQFRAVGKVNTATVEALTQQLSAEAVPPPTPAPVKEQ